MRALKQARKLIEKKPESPAAQALSTLVVALESETPFALQSLYQLDYDDFELALDLLKEWRLDRYYSSKVRLLDLSVQLGDMEKAAAAPAAELGRCARAAHLGHLDPQLPGPGFPGNLARAGRGEAHLHAFPSGPERARRPDRGRAAARGLCAARRVSACCPANADA